MEAFDILTYLDDKSIEYTAKGRNTSEGWISIKCLWCDDPSQHLGINLVAKTFSCFRCSIKGNAVTLIAEIEHCSRKKAYRITREYIDFDAKIKRRHRDDTHVEEVKLMHLSKEFSVQHIQYLTNRGYDAEYLIRKYDLYAGGLVGDFKFRIVAPVYLDGEIVSLVGRDITDKSDQRYKALSVSKSKLPIKSTLYNIDSIDKNVVIVEGIFDCWRIGDSCVATFGTKVTPEQILLLKGVGNAFVLFDADAKDAAEKLSSTLSGVVNHVEVIILDKGDPADMKPQEVLSLRKELRIS